MTPDRFTIGLCNAVMHSWSFDTNRRREWMEWAAKHQACPRCPAIPGALCVNLTDIRRRVDPPRNTRWPHDERVDWDRLLEGLKERNYWYPTIQRQVEAEWDAKQQSFNQGLEPLTIDDKTEDMPSWAKE